MNADIQRASLYNICMRVIDQLKPDELEALHARPERFETEFDEFVRNRNGK